MKNNNNHTINNYNAIDIFKFICAILVCTIHVPPLQKGLFPNASNLNFYIKNCLSRIAVPFFFTAAGFFLFKKLKLKQLDTTIIKDYCFKIIRLLGTWSVLLFVGNQEHLWYLSALVIAIIITTIFLKKGFKLKYILIIFIILYIIGLIGDNYYALTLALKKNTILKNIITNYEKYFKTTRNGLFFAPIFVLIGIIFATKEIKINTKLAYFGTIFSYFLLVLESFLLSKYSQPRGFNMYISLLPLIFFTFYMLINIKLKDSLIYKHLRNIGIIFYFMHYLVYYFLNITLGTIKANMNIDLYNYSFLLVVLITISISTVIEKISGTKKFRFLRYLYS